MKKIGNLYATSARFLGEVVTELKKCTWPTRQELIGSTVVVAISMILLGAFVGLSDGMLMGILRTILR